MGTATIGTGGRGMGFVRNDPKRPTLAVCDIDSTRRERAREKAGPLCTAYNDFREVLEGLLGDLTTDPVRLGVAYDMLGQW